jgi:hypothetical protein
MEVSHGEEEQRRPHDGSQTACREHARWQRPREQAQGGSSHHEDVGECTAATGVKGAVARRPLWLRGPRGEEGAGPWSGAPLPAGGWPPPWGRHRTSQRSRPISIPTADGDHPRSTTLFMQGGGALAAWRQRIPARLRRRLAGVPRDGSTVTLTSCTRSQLTHHVSLAREPKTVSGSRLPAQAASRCLTSQRQPWLA